MQTLTPQQWAERDRRIKAIETERLAKGWTRDQYGRWIEPAKGN